MVCSNWGVEENEDYEEAVSREIKEETGFAVEEIFPLNWGSIYNYRDEVCEEYNFVSFIKFDKITLNEEHSKYEWLNIDKFIEIIKWDDGKELLVLGCAQKSSIPDVKAAVYSSI